MGAKGIVMDWTTQLPAKTPELPPKILAKVIPKLSPWTTNAEIISLVPTLWSRLVFQAALVAGNESDPAEAGSPVSLMVSSAPTASSSSACRSVADNTAVNKTTRTLHSCDFITTSEHED